MESFTRLYKSVPFLIGLKNNHPYGIFFDNTYHSYFDLGKESNKYYYIAADNGNIDYYIIGGRDLKELYLLNWKNTAATKVDIRLSTISLGI